MTLIEKCVKNMVLGLRRGCIKVEQDLSSLLSHHLDRALHKDRQDDAIAPDSPSL